MHIRKNKSKGISVNLEKVSKAADVLGTVNVVMFSPEDLRIIQDGPAYRRKFVDMELCQLDPFYLYNLNNYNKIINQRNVLLKEIFFKPELKSTLDIWDNQLISYGSKVIERRIQFVSQLNEIIYDIHNKLSGGKEEIKIIYDPDTIIEDYERKLNDSKDRDIKSKITSTGPHRDDFIFEINGIDIRKFGSQGQQRTAALSLKLAEVELVKRITKDVPILLLDDVLSELDSSRQNTLLNSIGDVQTIITCTGLDEFVNNRFQINKVYKVHDGEVEEMNG
jgi:DNA replication and repair protein RecF